ncbi:hypothetical protein VTL71DRAFT_6100 [Oculimacula yallundae]|uniref:Uncharacterized protein n=1 Tax=Oculimacula yallundae TaxID=86028 RepID=A0ABR4BZF3_9HELO
MSPRLTYPEYYPKFLEVLKQQDLPSWTTENGSDTRWKSILDDLEAKISHFLEEYKTTRGYYEKEKNAGITNDEFHSWYPVNAPGFSAAWYEVQADEGAARALGSQIYGNFGKILSDNDLGPDRIDHSNPSKQF